MSPYLQDLADFLAAYVVILATPGPNMLLVGGAAATSGIVGALPLCVGVSLGAGALCGALLVIVRWMPEIPQWEGAYRVLGGALLLWVAVSVLRQQMPGSVAHYPRRGATLIVGFCTAATNPVTAAFFTAQFLGPLSASPAAPMAPGAIGAVAMSFMVVVAVLLARPACRALALAWHRPIRITAALILMLMAFSTAVGGQG
jgi:threonine/homoserine/homoserine lactone efflux protein